MAKFLLRITFSFALVSSNIILFAQQNNNHSNNKTSIELISSDMASSIIRFKMEGFNKRAVTTPQGDAFVIETDKGTPMLVTGAPDLEKLTTSLIIPDHAKMEVSIVSSSYTDYANISVAPSKGNITRDKNPDKIAYQYSNVYQENEFFPAEIAQLRDPYIMRDHRGQTIIVSPFQYNPISKILRVYNEIIVKVNIADPENGINKLTRKPGTVKKSEEFSKLYTSHFLNNQNNSRSVSDEATGNMLIICHDGFMDAMNPFVQWKNQKGIPTEIISVSAIGNDTTSLKNYIQNYYNTKELTYLLLVGDAPQITPLYYASSGHSDNGYAYVSGDDAYPEFFVGRFSAETEDHVETQVNRIIQYEKYPDAGANWYKNGIGIGSAEGPGDDDEYDYQHQRNLRSQLLNYTYSDIAELYDGSQGDADVSGDPSPADVAALVENGVGIINYTGHGGNESFVTTGFSNPDVDALNNYGKWPFIWSVACVNGEFVDYTCFAETWLRATDVNGNPAGAVSTLMSTINQSWNPPMEAQDQFTAILTESYSDNIKRSFGGISMSGCMKMNDAYGLDGAQMTDTWTLFGDPSVGIRTNTPSTINVSHVPSVLMSSSSLQVNCNFDGALVCLTVNSEIIGTGIISGNTVTINFSALTSTDPILVTVTGYNTIPYTGNVLVIPFGTKINEYVLPGISLDILPNPAHDNTVLKYALKENTDIKITLINTLGQEIKTLANNRNQPAGTHVIEFDASYLNNGVYFVRMDAGNGTMIRKIVVSK